MYDLLESYCIENMDSLYRLAYSYVRNREDALDIVSEATLKALKKRKELKEPEAIKAWLYKIVVNTALDFLRTQKKLTYIDGDLSALSSGKEDEYMDFDLHDALINLPEPYHTIIILRYFEDMKLQDIAKILNENINTVKSQLYGGLKKLRIKLTQQEA